MKIIDAHLHFATDAYFDEIAKAAEHENSADHLLEQYRMRGMVHGIVMGNLPVEELEPAYPPFLSYCIGLDSQVFDMAKLPQKLHLIEQHLKSERCVGIKLYPGYASFYLYDDRLAPVYELAARYKKPVTVHTGLTATDKALLKYSHPLVMDEAATKFREVQFVMCHFGNPFLEAAAAVLEKNPNVCADLSGLLEGRADLDRYFVERAGYVGLLRTWMDYLGCWDRFLYGTDWPIVNLSEYRDYVTRIVPEERRPAVFFDNANRVYGLGL